MTIEQIIAMNQYSLSMFSSIFGDNSDIPSQEPTDELRAIEGGQDD